MFKKICIKFGSSCFLISLESLFFWTRDLLNLASPALATYCIPGQIQGSGCCLVIKPCPTLHDHMDQSTAGPPVFHCLPKLGQIHVGRFDDTVLVISYKSLCSFGLHYLSEHLFPKSFTGSTRSSQTTLLWVAIQRETKKSSTRSRDFFACLLYTSPSPRD